MRKSGFLVAVLFHVILILIIIFFASKEGMLGKKMQTLAVTIVSKEKKIEQSKVEPPRIIPQAEIQKPIALDIPKPAVIETLSKVPQVSIAPPSVELPTVQFDDGAKKVKTISDPIELYRIYLEHAIKSCWNKPNIDDKGFEVWVEFFIDVKGMIIDKRVLSSSGNLKWDDSVRLDLKQITLFNKLPPKNFPMRFQVRFDTVEE